MLNPSYRGRKNEKRERERKKKMTIGRSLIQLSIREKATQRDLWRRLEIVKKKHRTTTITTRRRTAIAASIAIALLAFVFDFINRALIRSLWSCRNRRYPAPVVDFSSPNMDHCSQHPSSLDSRLTLSYRIHSQGLTFVCLDFHRSLSIRAFGTPLDSSISNTLFFASQLGIGIYLFTSKHLRNANQVPRVIYR